MRNCQYIILLSTAIQLVRCNCGTINVDYLDTNSESIDDSRLDGTVDSIFPPLDELPGCGNRVLEEGEDCDDGNRVNGDGCDWSCHSGNGSSSTDPDPFVLDYEPAGDSILLSESGHRSPMTEERLPLAWTGSEYATAWAVGVGSTELPEIEFRRFDTSGHTIDAPWTYMAPAYYGGLELVWIGNGFGLFYADMDAGLFYLRLDETGKPLGSPVLIEPDPLSRAPAADIAQDAIIVAWIREMNPEAEGYSWCSSDDDMIRLRLITTEGVPIGNVVTVDESAQGPPDVATGDDGFGLAFGVDGAEDGDPCMSRFVRLDFDLSNITSSGVCGFGEYTDMKWDGDHWVLATGFGTREEPDTYVPFYVIAIFSPDGILAGPPVVNSVPDGFFPILYRLSAGDNGLAIVAGNGMLLALQRTDSSGVPVGPFHEVVHGETLLFPYIGPFNTAWSDNSFGVLYTYRSYGMYESSVYLRRFVASP